MSKGRSTWKNTPEGRTIRRNVIPPGSQWSWWTIEMIESPAYRALNLSEHRVIARIRIEHAHHGGRDNGRLPVTFRDFQEYGVRWNSIAPAIRAAEALGWIRITQHGVASTDAEFRIPTKFALTHLATDDEAKAVTNDWQKIKTIEEAEAIAKKARKDSTPRRRISQSKKTFSHYRNDIQAEYRNDIQKPEILNTETVSLSPVETVSLSIFRGGGGGRGGGSRKRAARPEQPCRYCGEVTSQDTLTELYQGFFIHPACVEEWKGPELTGLMEWSAPVLVEVPYTPELRKLYCEAVEMEEAV